MKDKTALLKIRFVLLMALFGLLGPLVRAIGLPSPVTACLRAWVSAVSLIAFASSPAARSTGRSSGARCCRWRSAAR